MNDLQFICNTLSINFLLNKEIDIKSVSDIDIEWINSMQVIQSNFTQLWYYIKSLSKNYYINKRYFNYFKKNYNYCYNKDCKICIFGRDLEICIKKASLFIFLNILCVNEKFNHKIDLNIFKKNLMNISKLIKYIKYNHI
jgi:hypothetical protein